MKLYEHQKDCLEKTKDKKNVLYALDMGLGKTFVGSEKAISFNEPILCVCQKAKVEDWVEHFKTYYSKTWEICDLTKKVKKVSGKKAIYVINYDIVWRRQLEWFKGTLLLDESSLIQNERTKRFKSIVKLQRTHCILLSGTVVNGKYEKLWSQLRLLGWNIKKRDFYNKYVITRLWDNGFGFPIELVVGYKNIDKLKDRLRQLGAVFMKTEEVIKLPKQRFKIVYSKVPPELKKFKRDKVVDIEGEQLIADFGLTERLIERLLCSAYNKYRLDQLKAILGGTESRIIVFYTFIKEQKKIESICKKLDKPVSIICGNTRDLKAYNECENSVTLVQYQAGSMGLNLQKAHYAIYFSLPDGSSENFEQSKKRIHRIGQNNICYYYIMLSKGTVEEKIYEDLELKKMRIDNLFKEV